MRRCVLCGRWFLLAFQVEVGGFVCEACRVPVINGPALKIGPTVFLGIEQAAGRQSLLAVGAERHITCPSAYRAIGASVQKLWRAFGKLGVGSPALLFSFPLGCRW